MGWLFNGNYGLWYLTHVSTIAKLSTKYDPRALASFGLACWVL